MTDAPEFVCDACRDRFDGPLPKLNEDGTDPCNGAVLCPVCRGDWRSSLARFAAPRASPHPGYVHPATRSAMYHGDNAPHDV